MTTPATNTATAAPVKISSAHSSRRYLHIHSPPTQSKHALSKQPSLAVDPNILTTKSSIVQWRMLNHQQSMSSSQSSSSLITAKDIPSAKTVRTLPSSVAQSQQQHLAAADKFKEKRKLWKSKFSFTLHDLNTTPSTKNIDPLQCTTLPCKEAFDPSLTSTSEKKWFSSKANFLQDSVCSFQTGGSVSERVSTTANSRKSAKATKLSFLLNDAFSPVYSQSSPKQQFQSVFALEAGAVQPPKQVHRITIQQRQSQQSAQHFKQRIDKEPTPRDMQLNLANLWSFSSKGFQNPETDGVLPPNLSTSRAKKLRISREERRLFKDLLDNETKRNAEQIESNHSYFSNVLPKLHLHEIKYEARSKILQNGLKQFEDVLKDNNDTLNQQVYFPFELAKQTSPSIQAQENDLFQQFRLSNLVNTHSPHKSDNWVDGYLDSIQPNATPRIKLPSYRSPRTKKDQVIKSLLELLHKIKRMNFSIKEVIAEQLFSIDAVPRKHCKAFFEAVKSNNLTEVRFLLKEDKYLVTCTDKLRSTPLHIATKRGMADIVTTLIQNNSDVDARDTFGRTPLFYAFREYQKECAFILMKNKACPWSDQKNRIGDYAAMPKNADIYHAFRITKRAHLLLTICTPKERNALIEELKIELNFIMR